MTFISVMNKRNAATIFFLKNDGVLEMYFDWIKKGIEARK
jgi:hypothetical protein